MTLFICGPCSTICTRVLLGPQIKKFMLDESHVIVLSAFLQLSYINQNSCLYLSFLFIPPDSLDAKVLVLSAS